MAFPDFYGDIQSAVASRHDDPISLHELEVQDDVCLVRVLIFDGEVCSSDFIRSMPANVAAFHRTRASE